MDNGRKRLDWVKTAMNLAFDISEYRSQDLNTQVGACIIKNDLDILLGYNGAPANIEIDWLNREEKRKRVLHAESNVLARVKSGDVKIFCITHLCCLECLKLIAQKKIKTVYYSNILENYDSAEVFKIAKEFGIDLVQIKNEYQLFDGSEIDNKFFDLNIKHPNPEELPEKLDIGKY